MMSCEEGRAKRIKQCGEWWDVNWELHQSSSYIGRSTKCWVVSLKREGSDNIIWQVMKDTWANILTVDNEYKILKCIQEENLNHRWSLPHLYNWSCIPVPIGNSVKDVLQSPWYHCLCSLLPGVRPSCLPSHLFCESERLCRRIG